MHLIIRSLAWIVSLSILTLSNSYAAQYDTCMKWVIDGIGVHCKGNPEYMGTILFFKQMNDGEWLFQSTNSKFPFEVLLAGPGLEGPTVTSYGYNACEQFCDKPEQNLTRTRKL